MACFPSASSTALARELAQQPTCTDFANQEQLVVDVQSSYDQSVSFGNSVGSVNQTAHMQVTFTQEYIDGNKARWVPESVSGTGAIYGEDRIDHPVDGLWIDREIANSVPVKAFGELKLNRATCTYDLWASVNLNGTSYYHGEDTPDTHFSSVFDFDVIDRPAPLDSSPLLPTVAAREELPVYVVTTGKHNEFIVTGIGGEAVRALSSMNDKELAGYASVSWKILPPNVRCASGTAPINANDPALAAQASSVSSSNDADQTNNSWHTDLAVQPLGPDLTITSTLDSQALIPGQIATFSATLHNNGTAAAPQAGLTLTLPAELSFVGGTPAPAVNGQTLAWDFGALGPAATRMVTVRVNVRQENLVRGSELPLSFSFQATGTAGDIFPDNNQLVVQQLVSWGGDLAIDLQASGTQTTGNVRAGDTISLTVPYANASLQAMQAGRIEVQLDSGLTIIDAQPVGSTAPVISRNSVSWQLGTLAPMVAGSVQLRVKVGQIGAGAQIVALSSSTSYDTESTNNSAQLRLYPGSAANNGQTRIFLPLARR